jgi:hypothetical protein
MDDVGPSDPWQWCVTSRGPTRIGPDGFATIGFVHRCGYHGHDEVCNLINEVESSSAAAAALIKLFCTAIEVGLRLDQQHAVPQDEAGLPLQ